MLPSNSPLHLKSWQITPYFLCSWLLFLKVWGPFLCCGNSRKAVPNKKNSQLLYVKSLWKAAVSDFRDVIETQVQRFQGNVGLQLTAFNAADPVVMPETVRRRKRGCLVLSEKQKYPRLQQAPRLALSLYTQSCGDFWTAEEKSLPERHSLIPSLPLWLEPAHRYLQPSWHFLPSTELLTPLISFFFH